MRAKPAWIEAIRLYENNPSGGSSPDAPAPPVAADANVAVARAGTGMLWILNVLSFALAGLLAAMMVLAWQSLNKLDALDARLAALDGFERRLRDKVDRTNEGLQSRFEETNGRIQAFRGEMGALKALLAEAVAALDDSGARIEAALGERAGRLDDLPMDDLAMDDMAMTVPDPAPRAEAPAAARSGPEEAPAPPRFERVELPDGSVSYRRQR